MLTLPYCHWWVTDQNPCDVTRLLLFIVYESRKTLLHILLILIVIMRKIFWRHIRVWKCLWHKWRKVSRKSLLTLPYNSWNETEQDGAFVFFSVSATCNKFSVFRNTVLSKTLKVRKSDRKKSEKKRSGSRNVFL